jgi:mannose-6-phosphate isomerase-like protein (cupin superfamily)
MAKGMVPFEYERPQAPQGKRTVQLARTEFLTAGVQNVGPEGATNLHSHSGNDGFWFVLAGRARFYDENDAVVADIGPHQGVLVPHSTPYWFESGDENTTLEILHVGARTNAKHDKRVDYRERVRQPTSSE